MAPNETSGFPSRLILRRGDVLAREGQIFNYRLNKNALLLMSAHMRS